MLSVTHYHILMIRFAKVNVVMRTVVMLSVVMLSVVAPYYPITKWALALLPKVFLTWKR